MKKIIISTLATACIALSSCNNATTETNTDGTKFNPTERTSKMSDSEREAAISAKQASLNINIKALLESRGVKLTVLPPEVDGKELTEELVQKIAIKMINICTTNGIGGIGNVPLFAFTADFYQTGRGATGTAPQKMIVQYDVTYKVVNVTNGDVFGTTTQNLTGVGYSFEEANRNVCQEIKNTEAIQNLLNNASAKIIAWYNDNLETFKKQVEIAIGQNNFALALAMVEAVPEQSVKAFEYANQQQSGLLKKLMHQRANESLTAMQTAITEADGEFSEKVVGYFKMIPDDAPEYKQAQMLYTAYEKKIEAKNEIKKAEEVSEFVRRHELELAEIETDRLKAKYEAEATSKALEHDLQRKTGFWSTLGIKILDLTK